jgi:hypothetical protein
MKSHQNATFDTRPNRDPATTSFDAIGAGPQPSLNPEEDHNPIPQTSSPPQPECLTPPIPGDSATTTNPQSPIPNPQSEIRNPQYQLTFEQKDFMCKHIAAFKTYKEVAALLLEEFPDCPLTFEQVLKRIKYYACDNRTRKWRFRIIAYRNQLNHNLANRFRLGNKYVRLQHLETMFHEALQPRLKRIFWYPLRRSKDDKIIYKRVNVCSKDFGAAAKILSLISKELDKDSLEAIEDPFMVERSQRDSVAFDQEYQAFERSHPDASRDLDKTFGLI